MTVSSRRYAFVVILFFSGKCPIVSSRSPTVLEGRNFPLQNLHLIGGVISTPGTAGNVTIFHSNFPFFMGRWNIFTFFRTNVPLCWTENWCTPGSTKAAFASVKFESFFQERKSIRGWEWVQLVFFIHFPDNNRGQFHFSIIHEDWNWYSLIYGRAPCLEWMDFPVKCIY